MQFVSSHHRDDVACSFPPGWRRTVVALFFSGLLAGFAIGFAAARLLR
ncbi:MAG TPA: hypothetical protein VF128_16140 [Gemmatimonadaceae bacterium]